MYLGSFIHLHNTKSGIVHFAMCTTLHVNIIASDKMQTE